MSEGNGTDSAPGLRHVRQWGATENAAVRIGEGTGRGGCGTMQINDTKRFTHKSPKTKHFSHYVYMHSFHITYVINVLSYINGGILPFFIIPYNLIMSNYDYDCLILLSWFSLMRYVCCVWSNEL
jgi:hypothetical protein